MSKVTATAKRLGSRALEARLSGRGPGRLLVVGVLGAALVSGLYYADPVHRLALYNGVGRIAGFELRTLTLSGQKETSDSAIVATVGIDPGMSLLGLDVTAARERLEALPWVKSATLRKVFPGGLDVAIEEASAFARWQLDGREVLISRDGVILADDVPSRFRALPLVAGRGANEVVASARDLLAEHPQMDVRTVAAVLVNERRWDLRLDNGATVKLPEDGASAALVRLASLEQEGSLIAAAPAVIDLRLPDRTTVQFVPLEPQEEFRPEPLPEAAADTRERDGVADILGALMEAQR